MSHVPHLGPTLQLPEQSLQRFVSQELALCVHLRSYKNYFHWIEDRGRERKIMGRVGKELSFVLRSLSYKDTKSVFPQLHPDPFHPAWANSSVINNRDQN